MQRTEIKYKYDAAPSILDKAYDHGDHLFIAVIIRFCERVRLCVCVCVSVCLCVCVSVLMCV